MIGDIKVIRKLLAKLLKNGDNTSFIKVVKKGTKINKVNKKAKKESKCGNALLVLLKFLCINLDTGFLKKESTSINI